MEQIRIVNKQVQNTAWLDVLGCDFKLMSSVHVWSINISTNIPSLAEFSAVVQKDELERASRFYQQKDKDKHIISRAALRYILGRYVNKAPKDLEFGLGPNKKPFLKNGGPNIHFNLSHSKDKLLLAISNSEIGADMEFVNPEFKFQIMADNFSSEEISYINAADSHRRFYSIWTRKEAITKATAQGLDCDLRLLPGLDGDHDINDGIVASKENWTIDSFNIDENYIGSVAYSPSIQNLTFFKLPLIINLGYI